MDGVLAGLAVRSLGVRLMSSGMAFDIFCRLQYNVRVELFDATVLQADTYTLVIPHNLSRTIRA